MVNHDVDSLDNFPARQMAYWTHHTHELLDMVNIPRKTVESQQPATLYYRVACLVKLCNLKGVKWEDESDE